MSNMTPFYSIVGYLSEINLYPVKSLGGIKLDKALITKYGIAHPENTQIIDRFIILKTFQKYIKSFLTVE